MPRRRHFGIARTYRARTVPVRTRRPKQTKEEKRAKAKAYYHAHKAEINARRRAKRAGRAPASSYGRPISRSQRARTASYRSATRSHFGVTLKPRRKSRKTKKLPRILNLGGLFR